MFSMIDTREIHMNIEQETLACIAKLNELLREVARQGLLIDVDKTLTTVDGKLALQFEVEFSIWPPP